MKFTCNKTELTDALSICIHAVASKSPSPTLEGVLITVKKDYINICGYDLQISIERSIDAQTTGTGSFVMNARVFFDVMRKLVGDNVTIEIDDDLNTTVTCGRTVFNLKAESGDDFPELPDIRRLWGISLPANLLKEMINDTIFAVSTNENKPVHTGSKFEVIHDVLRIISIDGYRLAVRREDVEGPGESSFDFIVPGSALKELTRILPDSDEKVSVFPCRTHGIFEFGETTMTTRLLKGDFLDFRTAVPTDMPIQLDVSTKDMTDAVERVSVVVTERLKNPIRCNFSGENLQMSCVTALGKAFDEIQIPFCKEDIEIGFNSRYLLDALRACPGDENVIMELKSGLSPIIFRPKEGEKFLYMVLPVRLRADGVGV